MKELKREFDLLEQQWSCLYFKNKRLALCRSRLHGINGWGQFNGCFEGYNIVPHPSSLVMPKWKSGVLVLVHARQSVLLKAFITVISYRSSQTWMKAPVPTEPTIQSSDPIMEVLHFTGRSEVCLGPTNIESIGVEPTAKFSWGTC